MATPKKKQTKAGIKTTEFWISLLMPVLGVIIMSISGIEITPEMQQGIMMAFGISSGTYTLSRAHTKANDDTPNEE